MKIINDYKHGVAKMKNIINSLRAEGISGLLYCTFTQSWQNQSAAKSALLHD